MSLATSIGLSLLSCTFHSSDDFLIVLLSA
uniref:Uncharacterized protein n=1 Tax=Arundo donax TaxID=35708 RepID=A0A0A9EGY5_ARUDO